MSRITEADVDLKVPALLLAGAPTDDLQLPRLVGASPQTCLWIDLPMQSKPF